MFVLIRHLVARSHCYDAGHVCIKVAEAATPLTLFLFYVPLKYLFLGEAMFYVEKN